ncbi:uncharacterized protein EI90DRAFT_3056137 [Cantharellus anzutake]|uniref:uncharacterized protein n=1 Tax=Cantharellus anzutake TaxID=1750568 RepID=UPI0019085BF1|nr:uncharacterized protein EI90DRAFT_3056137 [Cantharellus anzutake]KAF8331981.1 hypothetical protein EI90DRAFT_3056137 [Cantharellus anzutake]
MHQEGKAIFKYLLDFLTDHFSPSFACCFFNYFLFYSPSSCPFSIRTMQRTKVACSAMTCSRALTA